MTPIRLTIEFAAAKPAGRLEDAIALFHRFMQRGLVEGLLIDVADYRHVPQGPGVLLVGHDVDYGVTENGFSVFRKRQTGVSAVDQFRAALRMGLQALHAIEADGGFEASFEAGRFRVAVVDRLQAENSEAGAVAIEAALAPVIREVFGEDTAIERAHVGDARSAVALSVEATGAVDLEAAIARLPAGEPLRIPYAAPQSEWDITAEELKALRDAGDDFELIDVREQTEFDAVNLDGRLVPLGSLEEAIPELSKDAHVVVHCHAGGRGAKAVEQLRKAGFENAWNLRGGILAWIDRIDPSLPRP